MKKEMFGKKGVSPGIATVLLIGLVIIIGAIIFLWFRNMRQEVITKFGETNVELICQKTDIDVSYSDGELSVSNTGGVPIYSFDIISFEGGNFDTQSIRDVGQDFPSNGLNPGAATSVSVSFGSAEKIKLIPVLLGNSEKGEMPFACGEAYGYELSM